MNYTKGEWKVDCLDDGNIAIRVYDTHAVARIATIFDNQLGNLANANLIAAAPRMYKLLERILNTGFNTEDDNFEELFPVLEESNELYNELNNLKTEGREE